MLMGFVEREFCEMWNIIIAMALQCLSVCLNCAFNILKKGQDFCKSSCEHYDDLAGSPTFCLLFMTMLNHLDVSCETR
jgi:hypothetical protein